TSLVMDRIWKPIVCEPTIDFKRLKEGRPDYDLGPYIELLRAPDSICFSLGDIMEEPFAGHIVASAMEDLAILFQGSIVAMLGGGDLPVIAIPSERLTFTERFLSAVVGRVLGQAAPSLLSTVAERKATYHRGRDMVIVSVLEGLPIPIEERLSWKQVMEIRADKESRDRLRRFTRWLDGALPSKSRAQINDDILIKLEDYRRALTKHGVEARIGVFERVVSWQPMLAKLAAAGAGSAIGEPVLGLIGAGSIALGEICVAIQKARLSLEDVHRRHEDVSFVFELKKLIETRG
ncbi:MAG TPA: hypothetical protein VMW75_14520, partial [Thermoanaerobaculia bacterium]|nr:hypothetical protein [Thermoanaerobaculia bacterium]